MLDVLSKGKFENEFFGIYFCHAAHHPFSRQGGYRSTSFREKVSLYRKKHSTKTLGFNRMPTIDRFNGFRVVIYSNDHRPSHVHVMGVEGEVVFQLQCPRGPLLLREVHGLTRRQVSDIGSRLDQRHKALCTHWSNLHGHH